MLCFLREMSQEMPGSQGYSATTGVHQRLPIYYPPTEEFTERLFYRYRKDSALPAPANQGMM
jgi:hypothetical protein